MSVGTTTRTARRMPYRPEGLKLIACQIVIGYRKEGRVRFTSADVLDDLRKHPDYPVLRKHNAKLEENGLRNAVLGAVVAVLRFRGTGPFAGDLCLRYVPVAGQRLHDLMFADDMTDNDWGAIETKRTVRLQNLQARLGDINTVRRLLQEHGPDATLAQVYGRMAVGF